MEQGEQNQLWFNSKIKDYQQEIDVLTEDNNALNLEVSIP